MHDELPADAERSDARVGWGAGPGAAESPPPPSSDPGPTPPVTPLAGRCLSCGAPIVRDGYCFQCALRLPGAAAIPEVPAEPVIVQDRVCLSCGYDLSGLRSDGTCPECGADILGSLRGNLLRYSSRGYVEWLHRGMLIAEIAVIGVVAVTTIQTGLSHVLTGMGMKPPTVSFLSELLNFAITITSVIGWWMFSTPDPAVVGEDKSIGARKLLRVALGIELVFTGAPMLMALLPLSASLKAGPNPLGSYLAWMYVVAALYVAAFVLRFLTSMLYMRTVAVRIPDAALYAKAGRFMWLAPLLSVVLCVFGVLVAIIMYILLLDRMRTLLKQTLAAMPRRAT